MSLHLFIDSSGMLQMKFDKDESDCLHKKIKSLIVLRHKRKTKAFGSNKVGMFIILSEILLDNGSNLISMQLRYSKYTVQIRN